MNKSLISNNTYFHTNFTDPNENEPLFCPNPDCKHHNPEKHPINWYKNFATYKTKAFGTVSRYICTGCGKTFSDQTFKLDYYAKKVVNYDTIISHITNSCSVRALSRILNVRVSTISNRIFRIARQLIWLQSFLLQVFSCKEDLVADGFESYTNSKYFPNNIHGVNLFSFEVEQTHLS